MRGDEERGPLPADAAERPLPAALRGGLFSILLVSAATVGVALVAALIALVVALLF
jgi:hypothetical protein